MTTSALLLCRCLFPLPPRRAERGGTRAAAIPRDAHPPPSLRKKMTGLRLHSASTAANSPGAESNRLDPHTSAHHGQSDIELPWLIDTQIKNEIHNFTCEWFGPGAYYQAGNRARHASVWQEYLSNTAGSHKLTRTMAVPLTPIPLDRFRDRMMSKPPCLISTRSLFNVLYLRTPER